MYKAQGYRIKGDSRADIYRQNKKKKNVNRKNTGKNTEKVN